MATLKFPYINFVIISGRLTRDPELRSTPSGVYVCNFSIANSRFFKSSSEPDGFSEKTTYINVVVWGERAERLHRDLKKGTPVIVEGILEESRWEDKVSGQRRSRIEIRMNRIHILSKLDDVGNTGDMSGFEDELDDVLNKEFTEGGGIEDL